MQQMYQEWPFFQSTIDLIEMILSKCDMRIAAMYDDLLAETEEEKALGVVLRGKYEETVKAVLEVLPIHWSIHAYISRVIHACMQSHDPLLTLHCFTSSWCG